jgi:plasmid stability protein
MEKKVKGYSDFMNSFQEGPRPEAVYCDFYPATLVVHEVDHERVFTESEVRELLRGMMQLIDGDPEQVLAAIEAVNAKHGLGLSDPA